MNLILFHIYYFSAPSQSLQQHCREVSQSMFYYWFFPIYHWLFLQSYYYHRFQNLCTPHCLSNWNPQTHTQMMTMERTYSECIYGYAVLSITICLKLKHPSSVLQIWDASNWTSSEPHGVFCESTCLIGEQVFYLLKRNFRNHTKNFQASIISIKQTHQGFSIE